MESMSQDETMDSGTHHPGNGKSVVARPVASDASVDTMADTSRAFDRIHPESASANTVADSAPMSQSLNALDASLETAAFTIPAVPGSARSRPSDTHSATLAELANSGHSDMTTDSGGTRRPVQEKTLQAAPSAAGALAPNEPPDYEICGELGRGGMGVVYKARHRRLNRLVALKMIRSAYADEIQVARFKIEAEAVATLRHPNILQIYDIGEHNGSPYVALELLEGGSLIDRLRGTALPPKQAAVWMVPMVMAMDAAHQAGIVHRDLKCANILFSLDGVPKITDFGLAKRLEADEGQTHTGQIMGTPSYMAPEQARGDTKLAGPPADIYALGAMLYEMITGRPPFKGVSAMDTVKQVLEQDPVSPSRIQFHVPRDLETICMKCLQKEPRKRYTTAKEMADDLNRYLRGEPIKARRTPPIERAVKWVKRHKARSTALAFVTTGLTLALAYGIWYWNEQRALERLAEQHLARVRDQTADDFDRAREAMARKDWDSAGNFLRRRDTLLQAEGNPRLASLTERAGQMLAEVDSSLKSERALAANEKAKNEVQGRYRHFLDHRRDALFRDTQFTGLLPSTNLELTRKAAEDALSVFGERLSQDDWKLGDLPAALSDPQQKAEVREGCYELFMVLADVAAGQEPPDVDRGLRVLESAARLRPDHPRAYHLKRASLLAAKNDRAGADHELAQAQLVPPQTSSDYFLIGQDEYKRSRYAEAISDFEMALRGKPDHFWARCLQAICFIRIERFDAAKANLIGCLDAEPNSVWLFLLRGFAASQQGATYLKLVPTSPGREASLKKGAKSEFEKAESDFHEALELLKITPDKDLSYILLVNRGLARFERGELGEAAADYLAAIKIKEDAVAHTNLATVYEKQGKTDEAIAQFGQAIALRPDWAPLYRGRADLLLNRADTTPAHRLAAQADLKLAIHHEDKDKDVLARDHTNLGRLYYIDEQYDDALEESKLALQIAPNHVPASVLQFRVLLQLRHYDQVISACNLALANGSKSAVMYEFRGLALSKNANYRGAIGDFTEALDLLPDNVMLLKERGWAYLSFEAPKLALDDFERAITLKPTDADAFTGRGSAHARLGDHRKAVADAREAIRVGKADPRVIYNAARIYAMAVSIAASQVGEKGRSAAALASQYQDAAVQLIKECFEREPPDKRPAFWRDTIQTDPALKVILRRLKYDELIASNKKTGD
jgi:eukaryotic-like serine/threonine-protein kinase